VRTSTFIVPSFCILAVFLILDTTARIIDETLDQLHQILTRFLNQICITWEHNQITVKRNTIQKNTIQPPALPPPKMDDKKDAHSNSTTTVVAELSPPLPKSSTDTTTSALKPRSSTIMEIDHRTDRSLLMAITHAVLRPFGPMITKMTNNEPAGSPKLNIAKHATTRAHVSHRTVAGVHIYDMTPKLPHMGALKSSSSEKARRKRIYYFAGGGWRMPASADHWALTSKLAASCPDTTVSLVSYPLAPNSPAPESIPILLELLPILLNACAATNETAILAGDSAGGNLALALPLEMLRAATEEHDPNTPPPPMPAHILVVSPSTDLRRCNPEIPIIERKDPLLRHEFVKATSETWRGSWPADDTRLSPLLLPLHVLRALSDRGVQVHGVTGGYDILTPDALLFRDRLVEAGVGGSWLHWEKQMHVYPVSWRYGLREARKAKDWMVEVINKKM
jgi:acetyl esterase/lipase